MKVSKKEISLITFSVVLSLLLGNVIISAIGVDTTPLPADNLQWNITGLEIIDGIDYYMNETITIENGGELRILNTNFYINNVSLYLYVQYGAKLYVENSTMMITAPTNSYRIQTTTNATAIQGANYEFKDSFVYDARISITQSTLLSSQFIADNTTFELYSEFKLTNFVDIDIDDCTFYNSTKAVEITTSDNVYVHGSTFQEVIEGLSIERTDGGEIGYNTFIDINQTGLIIDDFSSVVGSRPRVEIIWNTFEAMETGAYLQDSRVHFMNNDIRNVDTGIVLDNSDNGIYENNNFTEITGDALYASETRSTYVQNSIFENIETAMDLYKSPLYVMNNQFYSTIDGLIAYDSDGLMVSNNTFDNITNYAMDIDESREIQLMSNTITNSLGGIYVSNARICSIEDNSLNHVLDGVAVTYSRDVSVIGNTVNDTISGFYVETTTDIIFTANGAIYAEYGISLWSVSEAILASNGVFDSVFGLSVWFSESIVVSGNDVSSSQIGMVGRNSLNLEIRDGSYTELNRGIQLLGCNRAKLYGNTFDDINEVAITFSDSSDFIVYNNNFLNVTSYGDIENSFGTFYKAIDNETYLGNYYESEPPGPVLIDTFIVDLVTYNITDYYQLDEKYVVIPSVEFIERELLNPTDVDPVVIIAQIFIPEETQNVEVYLQYQLINETFWRLLDITATEEPIGSIGAISQFEATIQPLPYSYQVVYRIMVNFTISSVAQSVFSGNGTYTVGESEFTPIVIGEPEVRVVTFSEAAQTDITVVTNSFYSDTEYLIFVGVKNKTDLQIIGGKRHVNLSWYEIDPETNDTAFFTGVMDYNSSLEPIAYSAAFGRGYPIGMIIEFYISVVDWEGNYYRTVLNFTMVIQPPVEETGFDTITLLSLGGTLLLVQIIVVVRRRRKTKEE